MPIQKFKSFEDASKNLWNYAPDNEYYRRTANFYKLSCRLIRFSSAVGVYKFRSFEEAEKQRMDFLLSKTPRLVEQGKR